MGSATPAIADEQTVRGWIASCAADHGDSPALLAVSGSAGLSFSEMRGRVDTLVDRFRECGIGRESRVAVALTDGPDTLMVLLALMRISAVLPVHPAAAEAPLDALIERVGITAVVGGDRPASAPWQVAEARGLTYVTVEVEPARTGAIRLTPSRALARPEEIEMGLDDVVLYITTSGTTGGSTIVAITQRSLDRNAATHGLLNEYGPGTRAICVMPFTYLFAYVRSSLPMLRYGGALAVAPGYRFADMQRWCATLKPTCMTATPTILKRFIHDAQAAAWRPGPGVLERFHATGEAIPDDLRASLREVFGARLGTNYGMTEVSPQVATVQPEETFGPGAVGRVVPPWKVEVIDDAGAARPVGAVGRITLRGGYVNTIVGMSSETRFDSAGRFLTGDRGHIGEDGVLYISGRMDDVINRGGEKIDPKSIEQALEHDPDVLRAVVFGLPDPTMGQTIMGLVVLRDGATRSAQEVREAAGQRLSGWSMPERLIAVPRIPMNANGKVSRVDLAERFADA